VRNEKSPKRDLLSKNTDGMTKRSDVEERARRGRKGGTVGERRNARRANGARSSKTRAERSGEELRGKGDFPKASYGAL